MDRVQSKRSKTAKRSAGRPVSLRSHEQGEKEPIEEVLQVSKKVGRSGDRNDQRRAKVARYESGPNEAEGNRSASGNSSSSKEKLQETTVSPVSHQKKRKAASMREQSQSSQADEADLVERQTGLLVESNEVVKQDTSSHAQIQALQEENRQLQSQLALKDSIMNLQKETISFIYGQCTCMICMELVWRPHVLSPCGHIFCARCLVAWFSK
jgi:hypothetical protein